MIIICCEQAENTVFEIPVKRKASNNSNRIDEKLGARRNSFMKLRIQVLVKAGKALSIDVFNSTSFSIVKPFNFSLLALNY